jgi:type IV secretion system protein VirB5
MKRFLIAGASIIALSGHARAQGVTVNDPASIMQEVNQLEQMGKTYVLQAQQALAQAQELAAFVHNPSLGAATGLMNQTGLSNDLPVNPMAIASLTNGYGSLSSLSAILGKLTTLSSLVGTNYSTNHVYSPTDGSWNSQQLIANGQAIAGTQGAAQAAYQDLRNHLPILQALRDRLATATTPKDVQDAQAQIESEQAWTNNLNSELQAIQVNYQAQADSRMQRDNESLDAGIDSFLAQANAAGRGLTP